PSYASSSATYRGVTWISPGPRSTIIQPGITHLPAAPAWAYAPSYVLRAIAPTRKAAIRSDARLTPSPGSAPTLRLGPTAAGHPTDGPGGQRRGPCAAGIAIRARRRPGVRRRRPRLPAP